MENIFESICKKADECKTNLTKLNELWTFLKANKDRMEQTQFEYAAEHIGNYVVEIEDRQDALDLLKKIDSI